MRVVSIGFSPIVLPDGREAITDMMVREEPAILDFIARFPDWWRRHDRDCAWVSVRARWASEPIEVECVEREQTKHTATGISQ